MDETTKVIRIVIDSSKAVDGSAAATRALQNLEKQAGSMDSTMARIEKSIVGVGLAAKAWLAEKLLEVGARILEMGKSALEAAANLAELADQMGITTTGLQALQFAAVQNNLKIDELQIGVSKFSQKLGEAANGSKPMIDALNEIGVKMLDASGKIRPTETLLQEVARAIVGIEDPAKRASAAVDFFGKAGTKMIPTLREIADGMDVMAGKASKAGAMISAEAIDKLDKMADAGERSKLVMRALFAENAAGPLTDVLDFVNRKMLALSAYAKAARGDVLALISFAMNPGLAIGAALNGTPQEQNTSAIGKLEGDIAGYQRSLDAGDLGSRGQASQRALMAKAQTELAQRRAAGLGFQAKTDKENASLNIGDPDGIGIMVNRPATGGASNPTSKEDAAAGQAISERIKKETDSLKAAADAQDLMTAAARRGDVAFVDQEAHVTALQKAIDVYGGKLDAADPKVQKLTASLEEQIKRAKEGKAAETFVVATTELEKQNELLEAQNRLYNERPEIQAREIALIKSKQEAQKAGNALTADDVENRRAAIEQNEKLKTQAEQLKQANELWTAPLKQALQNIQTAGADAFESMLNNGNVTFQSLGDTFSKIIKRMIAEFLALATIRPIMGIVVQALGGSGLISGNTAGQLGFPSGGGGGLGGLLGGLLGGGSGGGVIMNAAGGSSSGGGLGALSNLGSFANLKSIGSSIASYGSQAFNWASGLFSSGGSIGAGLANGTLNGITVGNAAGTGALGAGVQPAITQAGTAASSSTGILGAIPVWGWITLAATIAKQFTAGKPSNTPLGAADTLLGPSLDQWQSNPARSAFNVFNPLGPAGAAIAGLFGFDPFGGSKGPPPQPPLAYGAGGFYSNGAGGYSSSGNSLNGGTTLGDQAGAMGKSILTAFSQAGLKVVQGNLYGGEIASGMDHTLGSDGMSWMDRPYTQTSLALPGGGIQRLTYNDSSMDANTAAQYLFAQVFKANVLNGGVSGASDSLKSALTNKDPRSQQDITDVVNFTKSYDALGKTTNSVKDTIDALNVSMDAMRATATSYGLSLQPIADAQAKQTKRVAQDFIDNMLDPLAVQMRALDDERASAVASAQYIKDNVEGVYVDMDKIATYYTNKRAQLEEQYYQGSVSNLQNLIARLTYGDLANASPDTSLSGTGAAYKAALAQARSGDPTAISNLSGYAEAYATSARSYFASGPEYAALIAQIRQDLATQVASITGVGDPSAPGASNVNDAANVMGQQYAQLVDMFQQSEASKQQLMDKLTILTAQLARQA